MIRTIQGLIKLAAAAAAIGIAVAIYYYPIGDIWSTFVSYLRDLDDTDPNQVYLRQGLGIAAAAAVVIALLPMFPKRLRKREITFEGSHGEVTIDLNPVEATLERVVGKLPEVKTVAIRLKPDGPGKVIVNATGILLKDANSDARQVTARVNSFIQSHTRKILGLQDVNVKFKVIRWVMNMKTVKPEPLLLEAPHVEHVSVRPAAAAVSPAPVAPATPKSAQATMVAATAPVYSAPLVTPPPAQTPAAPAPEPPRHVESYAQPPSFEDTSFHSDDAATEDDNPFEDALDETEGEAQPHGNGEHSDSGHDAGLELDHDSDLPEARIDWSAGGEEDAVENEEKSSRGW